MYAVINNSMGSGSVTYECEGNETRLSDCMPSTDSTETCHYALVNCVPKTQVFVAQTIKAQEADGDMRVCLQTNRVVTEPLHVHVETTDTNITGNMTHRPAIGRHDCTYSAFYLVLHVISYSGDYDYKTTTHTLMFEPSGSQQQCLEIEIINDSLPEGWEVFTLLLSTNNSAVDLIAQRVDVYIQPNDGI